MPGLLRAVQVRAAPLWAMLAAAALPGCSTLTDVHDFFLGGPPTAATQRLTGFIGGAAADEPNAALVARDVLATGGNAADAAVALGFTLAVSLPSRASLGAGGACLVYDPNHATPGGGQPEAILFNPVAPATGARADRPAAVPMLARGLYLLHARHGKRPFESLVAPAEQRARLGIDVPRALARDLAEVSGPLLADPNARAVFGSGGRALAEGARLTQPDLGAVLAQIRVSGVGDLYQGALANRLADAIPLAGGGVSAADLRNGVPRAEPPIVLPAGRDRVAFLPPPADGGLAAAAAFATLRADPNAAQAAQARALATAARWRAGGADANALLAAPAAGGTVGPLPASTSFVVLDRDGMAVACAETMNNLFGTGRVAPGTGIVLAASPASVHAPMLAAAIAWNGNLDAFRAAVGGSGQDGAALAVAAELETVLRSDQPAPVPDPGRANAIACTRYLPGAARSCGWATDPRGAGLAIGGD